MISSRVVSRATGDKAAERPQLNIVATQPLQDLRNPGLMTKHAGRAGIAYSTGVCGNYYLDPPVGSWAAAETVLDLPAGLSGAPSAVYPVTIDYTFAFAPGIWEIEAAYHSFSAVLTSDVMTLAVVGPTAADTNLGPGVPGLFWALHGTSTLFQRAIPKTRFVAESPFHVLFTANGVMTDAKVWNITLAVLPVQLFDGPRNVF